MKVVLKNHEQKEVSPQMAKHLKSKGALLNDPFSDELTDLDPNDYSLSELRELFPDVKARSKAEFIEKLGA